MSFFNLEFSGREVLLIANTEPAFALSKAAHKDFDIVVAFNSRANSQIHSVDVTHWCVNLGTRARDVKRGAPSFTPYHNRWGNLRKAVDLFERKGAVLIHPETDLFPFTFQEVNECMDDPEKQPSCGLYLIRRLLNAGITPTLAGFTGQVHPRYHDPKFEQIVLKKLMAKELIKTLPETHPTV